ncbi:MAG: HIT domain-containing protein, partial [Deltaproteobacteria bacterium]|nr:HIT domain-containing protein [Deltaproteobacteria bacterium]
MEVLWAPWRMEYILTEGKETCCIFCTGDNSTREEDRLILHKGKNTIVMMNKIPYVNGHLLVSPVKHSSGLCMLNDEERLDLINMVSIAAEILKKALRPEGLNVGLNLGKVAGAGVEEHMHFHVVPRWYGDSNFMTVIADVRVIPEH